MSVNIDILNTLIQNQKSAIRHQGLFALMIIILGFCLILISTFYFNSGASNDSIKLILMVGGGFISTISAYPINQIITRKEKIKTFEIFKLKINDLSKAELKRVEELIWKSIEKIV